jgi:hypothetical protein
MVILRTSTSKSGWVLYRYSSTGGGARTSVLAAKNWRVAAKNWRVAARGQPCRLGRVATFSCTRWENPVLI